jgi:ligand-binding sensor domain-containing protein
MAIPTMKELFCAILLIQFTACNVAPKSSFPEAAASFTSKKPKLGKAVVEQHNVHCSLQDREGNLWFGTTGNGVFRFDGQEFMQFTKQDGLSNNTVWSILEDRTGRIWFGTDDGVSRFDGTRILKIPLVETNMNGFGTPKTSTGKNPVWSIFEDRSGTIWLGTSDDLYVYDGAKMSRFLDSKNPVNSQNLQLKWIQCILEDRSGMIWMGSGPMAMEGVIQFDGTQITSTKPNGDGWIRYMVEDLNGKLWFGGRSNGNFTFDGKVFSTFFEKKDIGNPILVDRSGKVWFTGEEKLGSTDGVGGIWSYDGQRFQNYSSQDGLGKYSVWSMLADSNGNIWIGTRNNGLYRFDGHSFQSFSE